MANVLGELLGLRNQLQHNRVYKYTSGQAYTIAFLSALLGCCVYIAIVERDFRYSTLISVGALIFLIALDLIDFEDQEWYRIITYIILALVLFKIFSYELVRIMNKRNQIVNAKQVNESENTNKVLGREEN